MFFVLTAQHDRGTYTSERQGDGYQLHVSLATEESYRQVQSLNGRSIALTPRVKSQEPDTVASWTLLPAGQTSPQDCVKRKLQIQLKSLHSSFHHRHFPPELRDMASRMLVLRIEGFNDQATSEDILTMFRLYGE